MLFWTSFILALLALGVAVFVVMRHWKEIRLMDPDTIRTEQERQTREHIVAQRFQRRVASAFVPVRKAGRFLSDRMVRSVREMEGRLARLAVGARAEKPMEPANERVQDQLAEANGLLDDARYPEAERAFLEVLKEDARQVGAYRGLARLYLAQKQLSQARETYRFIERIHGGDDETYAGLAEIAEAEGAWPQAEALRKRAVDAAPKDALRRLELSAFYLAHGSPDFALGEARKAVALDGGQPRSLELCLEAAILVRDREEAERCLERYRLKSDDRLKFNRYREKIDALARQGQPA